MKKAKNAVWVALPLAALFLSIQPVPKVEATDGSGFAMIWMATANWLGCDQNGPTPDCADYGTPTGSMIRMTCCVPRSALGTSDMSACSGDGGIGRARTEL